MKVGIVCSLFIAQSIQFSGPIISDSLQRHQSFPASGYFPMSQFFPSVVQSIGISAIASVLPMNIQNWFPSGLSLLISCIENWACSIVAAQSIFFLDNTSCKIMYLYPWRYISVIPAAKHYSLFWGSLKHPVKKKKKTNRPPPPTQIVENYLKGTIGMSADTVLLVAWKTAPSTTAQRSIDFPQISDELWGCSNHIASMIEGKYFLRDLNSSK